MSLRDDLIAAKALISNPAAWMKGNLADVDDTCFCAYGAIQFAPEQRWRWGGDHEDVVELIEAQIPPDFVWDRRKRKLASYNDDPSTTHADIMALFDRAIAAASPTPSIDMSKQGAGDGRG